VCSATVYKPRTLLPLLRCETFVLTVTFSPTQSCDALVTDGPPAYPTRWGAWRDIGVGSGLALIPLVTGPLPSPQKVNLKGCAAPPFISPGPSHLSSDVGLFVSTVTQGMNNLNHSLKTRFSFLFESSNLFSIGKPIIKTMCLLFLNKF